MASAGAPCAQVYIARLQDDLLRLADEPIDLIVGQARETPGREVTLIFRPFIPCSNTDE